MRRDHPALVGAGMVCVICCGGGVVAVSRLCSLRICRHVWVGTLNTHREC